jgi:uncharacterized protein
MWGTIVNALAIIFGTALGCLLKKGIPEKVQRVIMQGLGLATVVIGITSAIKTENILLFIISLAAGGAIGRMIGIEDGLERFGEKIQNRFSADGDSKIAEGFVTATLVFCVGAMAILGSIESGANGNHEILYVKSMLDGVAAMIFASTLGLGVGLSAIAVFVYQGIITLCASWITPILTDQILLELSAVGGVLILGIGINLLGIKKIHVGDMLPAILIPPIYYVVMGLF